MKYFTPSYFKKDQIILYYSYLLMSRNPAHQKSWAGYSGKNNIKKKICVTAAIGEGGNSAAKESPFSDTLFIQK